MDSLEIIIMESKSTAKTESLEHVLKTAEIFAIFCHFFSGADFAQIL